MNEDWRNAFGILMLFDVDAGRYAVMAREYAMAGHRLALVFFLLFHVNCLLGR